MKMIRCCVAVLAVALCAFAGAENVVAQVDDEAPTTKVGSMSASFFSKDLHIALIRPAPIPNLHPGVVNRLRIITPPPARDLKTIYQLIGLVHIDGPAMALEYARLRTATSLPTRWHFDDLPDEYEVVSQKQLPDMPAFNLPDYDSQTWLGTKDTPTRWGFLGVLSDAGFKQGGFTEPTVAPLPKGKDYVSAYEVIRWTFREENQIVRNKQGRMIPMPPRRTVQQIREVVYPDGTYSRKELISKPAPNLPNTRWSGDYFF